MSDSDDGNPAPGGPESPEGEVGAWVRAAGAEDAVIFHSGPQGDRDAAAWAVGVSGAVGSLGEEAGAVGALEGSNSEEDSDIWLADDGEENMERGPDMVMDPNQLPLAGFNIMFLDLVRTMLHRLYHNDHILIRPCGGHSIILPRPQVAGQAAQIRVFSVPEASGEGAVAMLPTGPGDGAVGSGEGSLALPEPEDKAEAAVEEESAAGEKAEEVEEVEEEPLQEAEAPEETTEEEAQGAESKEEKGLTKTKKDLTRMRTQQRADPENPVWRTRKKMDEEFVHSF